MRVVLVVLFFVGFGGLAACGIRNAPLPVTAEEVAEQKATKEAKRKAKQKAKAP